MSDDITFPATTLVGFLRALDFELEQDDRFLWAKRTVAGEKALIGFYAMGPAGPDIIRDARRTLSRGGRSEPSAALNLITVAGSALTPEETEEFTDMGVRVCSEVEYLSQSIQARLVCDALIKNADRYIPEREYVSQHFAPDNVPAETFLDQWITSDDGGLLVILGHAGFGKTCLANDLARRLARRHQENGREPVPFLLPLHRHRHVRRFEELILTHLQDHNIYGFTSGAFAYLVNAGRVLPVLDGFDELAETGGLRAARETLRGLINQIAPCAKILLTSRQAYFRHRGDLSLLGSDEALQNLQTVELKPFDQDQRATFLERRGLSKEEVRKVQGYVQEVPAEELLASPLVLKILADEVKAGGTVTATNATTVFALCLRSICQRELEPVMKVKFPWSADSQIAFLTSVADLMLEENSYQLSPCDEWLADVVLPDVPKGLATAKEEEEVQGRVTQLKNHPLLMGFVSDDGNAIEFLHQLYRDFFVAHQFEQHIAEDHHTRKALRVGLPEASTTFLGALLNESALADLFRRAAQWRESARDLWACAIAKCDLKSKNDISARTAQLGQCLAERRDFDNENLSRLRFSLIRFAGLSFVGADFTQTTFQSCEFRECDFNGANFGGCRFYDCSADERTGAILETLGVPRRAVERRILRAPIVHVQNDDPVRELVRRFFERFIRRGLGMHQRTAARRSMFRGLGGEDRKFTERELIPEMKKSGVIQDAGRPGVDVYVFNSDWQQDGDAIVGQGTLTDRLQGILETLRSKSARYNLL